REKVFVREVVAPEGRVPDPGLRHRSVQVQHADESRPGATPVRHRQDRRAMRGESVQHMVRILPGCEDDDKRLLRVYVSEDLPPVVLTVYEAVSLLRIVGMSPNYVISFRLDGSSDRALHPLLFRP